MHAIRSPYPVLLAAALLLTATLSSQQLAWRDAGAGKAGTNGTPILNATPIQPGKVLRFSLSKARGNANVVFVIGLRTLGAPALNGILVPYPDWILAGRSDAGGLASVGLSLPNDPRLLSLTVAAQCGVDDPRASYGVAFSNAIVARPCNRLVSNVEDFQTTRYLDATSSAGSWGKGTVDFAPIGGTGVLGEFDAELGKDITPASSSVKVYEWSTDNMLIPATHTRTGQAITVTDGRFEFASLTIPDGVEVHFIGSNPAQIWVRGQMRIGGLLAANGQSIKAGDASIARGTGPQPGEKGGKAGCFGGAGGDGGDRGNGNGTPNAAFNGKDGKDLVLKSGHAYAGKNIGTGGKGSPQHPADNNSARLSWAYFNVITVEMNKGGGGAGFRGAGGTGAVTWSAPNANFGQYAAKGVTVGGISMAFPPSFPTTYPPGFSRADHYLVGGAGGGGGGSAPAGAIKSSPSTAFWKIGRGGGGGGGAISCRVGGSLLLDGSGRLECEGGFGSQDDAYFSTRGMMTPGGGGSGGSLFLQIVGATNNQGVISVRGGAGGFTKGNRGDTIFAGAHAKGGAGADGNLHFEVGDPTSYPVGRTIPAAPPIARLSVKEADPMVTVASRWYLASIAPNYQRYEIDALVDGKPVVFSDDPKFGTLAAGPTAPLRLKVQGARQVVRDQQGNYQPWLGTTVGPFVDYVGEFSPNQTGLADWAPAGYRFELTLDRTQLKTVVVRRVTVIWCE